MIIFKFIKPFLFFFFICAYSALILLHVFHRKGLLSNFIFQFKDAKVFKRKINKKHIKINYYKNLLVLCKNKDRDAIAIVMVKNLNTVLKGYRLIDLKEDDNKKN